MRHEFGKAQQRGAELPLAVLDIDYFKRINDQYGHVMGDQVLQAVARILLAHIRPGDLAARYGGEEFVLILPRTNVDQAVLVCERIRQVILNHDWTALHKNMRVTISIGLSADTNLHSHEQLLSAADAKLYRAKDAGRNRLKV